MPIHNFLTDIENHLPANNPLNDGTKELSIHFYENINGNGIGMDFFESDYNETTEISATTQISPGIKYVFLGHDHPNGISIFSMADLHSIKTLIDHGGIDSNTIFYVNTYANTKFAFTISDIDVFKVWLNQFFMGWDVILPPGMENGIITARENDYEEYVKKDFSKEKNERVF